MAVHGHNFPLLFYIAVFFPHVLEERDNEEDARVEADFNLVLRHGKCNSERGKKRLHNLAGDSGGQKSPQVAPEANVANVRPCGGGGGGGAPSSSL